MIRENGDGFRSRQQDHNPNGVQTGLRLCPTSQRRRPFFAAVGRVEEAEEEEEEEPVRGGPVLTQLGTRVSHGQDTLDRRLLPDHQDQPLQGPSFLVIFDKFCCFSMLGLKIF